MSRGWLFRVLLAVALASATGIGDGRSQVAPPPTPTPTPAPTPIPIIAPTIPITTSAPTDNLRLVMPSPVSSHRDNSGWYALGGVVTTVVIGLVVKSIFNNSTVAASPQRTLPPRQTVTQFQGNFPSLQGLRGTGGAGGAGGGAGGGGGGGAAGGGAGDGGGAAGAGGAPGGPARLRTGFNLPPPGVTQYQNDRVVSDIPVSVPVQELDAIAARHDMTRLESVTLALTGRTLHLWRINSGVSVPSMITSMASEPQVVGMQPNYLYRLAQAEQIPIAADQYAPQKIDLPEAHRLARGNRILVAIIDSKIDTSHPDLAGAITASFDAAADNEAPHLHGTGMAGAIAAHRNMLGTAPGVGLLTVRAFSAQAGSAEGTTFNILKGLDWAASQGARVVNMSFAGPPDPRLRDALAKANTKGMVLIAAAGNAGPNSPPLFPAADPSVIAVTATNANDGLFEGANRGNYIAVAAPGVDILAPAPDGAYQFTTGTSVAAAEVSGVAALLIERNPALTPAEVRKILMDTARDLGPRGRDRDFGAGLINAFKALTAIRPR
jgi:hypothetical protein